MLIEKSTGYSPRELQKYLHKHLKRFNVIVAHRRFGKSVFCIAEMIDQALNCPLKNPQTAYISPNYGQSKRIAWDYAKDLTKDYPYRTINEHELRIDLERPDKGDRARLMLLGAENPSSLRGIYLDLAVLDEVAEMTPDVWTQVIRPALVDRMGKAIFIGTPKGDNHFKEIYEYGQKNAKDWFTAMFRADETKIIPDTELKDAKALMLPEEYDQEFLCSFNSAIVGSYFAQALDEIERKGQITEVPYDKNVRVSTWWDLGISDATAIWFTQSFAGKHHVIDYYETSGQDLSHFMKVLQDKPYIYGHHELPHDAAARDLSTGMSTQELLWSIGLKPNPWIQANHRKNDKLNAALSVIPLCWFDKKNCAQGLKALRHYKRRWDQIKKVFAMIPLHDWSSHGADAFQIFAMGSKKEERRIEPLHKKAISDYDIFG